LGALLHRFRLRLLLPGRRRILAQNTSVLQFLHRQNGGDLLQIGGFVKLGSAFDGGRFFYDLRRLLGIHLLSAGSAEEAALAAQVRHHAGLFRQAYRAGLVSYRGHRRGFGGSRRRCRDHRGAYPGLVVHSRAHLRFVRHRRCHPGLIVYAGCRRHRRFFRLWLQRRLGSVDLVDGCLRLACGFFAYFFRLAQDLVYG